MNAHQRRRAIRAGTHYRCDFCSSFRPMPYDALTGCNRCWLARRPPDEPPLDALSLMLMARRRA